jgi:hypothetical protein
VACVVPRRVAGFPQDCDVAAQIASRDAAHRIFCSTHEPLVTLRQIGGKFQVFRVTGPRFGGVD